MNQNQLHTPGPWEVKATTYPIADTGDYDTQFDIRANGKAFAFVHDGDETAKANARLIAAAPELLEALCDTLDALECWTGSDVRIIKAKSAIAKATGANHE